MSSYDDELNQASKAVQNQISEAEEKIGETTRQFLSVWAKTLQEMNRTVMSRASAEMQLGSKLSGKLSAARSPSDAISAYQEWLTEEMEARSEDARLFMAGCQKFISESRRSLSKVDRTGAWGGNARLRRADTIFAEQCAKDYTRQQWEAALRKAKKRTTPGEWPFLISNDFWAVTLKCNSSGSFAALAAILRVRSYLWNFWAEEISAIAGMICWPTIAMSNFVPAVSINRRLSIVRYDNIAGVLTLPRASYR
jgi:hypothetical protein